MKRVVVLVGANGMLGKDAQEVLAEDFEVLAFGHKDLDITDPARIRQVFRKHRPDLVVNAAAKTAVDACEAEVEETFRVNALGARNLAVAAERASAELVQVSTDYVFDGSRRAPYDEFHPVQPQGVYARSKEAGEQMVRSLCRRHYILRVGVLFGLHRKNFVDAVVDRARRGENLQVPRGRVGCPTHTWDIAEAIRCLAGSERYGTLHFNQGEPLSRAEFAKMILKVFELSGVSIDEVEPESLGEVAPRPEHLDLSLRQWKLEGFPTPRGVEAALQHLKERKDGNTVTQGQKLVWPGMPPKKDKPDANEGRRPRTASWVPAREYTGAPPREPRGDRGFSQSESRGPRDGRGEGRGFGRPRSFERGRGDGRGYGGGEGRGEGRGYGGGGRGYGGGGGGRGYGRDRDGDRDRDSRGPYRGPRRDFDEESDREFRGPRRGPPRRSGPGGGGRRPPGKGRFSGRPSGKTFGRPPAGRFRRGPGKDGFESGTPRGPSSKPEGGSDPGSGSDSDE